MTLAARGRDVYRRQFDLRHTIGALRRARARAVRIAILNWTSRPVGGSGSYLRTVIPALVRRGHEIAFWHELGEPPDGDPLAVPEGSPIVVGGTDGCGSCARRSQRVAAGSAVLARVARSGSRGENTADRPRSLPGARLLRHVHQRREDVQESDEHAMLTHVRLAVSGPLLSAALRWVESDHDGAGVSPAVSAFRAVVSVQGDRDAVESHAAGVRASWSRSNVGQGRSGTRRVLRHRRP